jgi:hypothetical protein
MSSRFATDDTLPFLELKLQSFPCRAATGSQEAALCILLVIAVLQTYTEHVPGTRSQIEEPEVLVGDFTTQNHECLCAMEKSDPSRARVSNTPNFSM